MFPTPIPRIAGWICGALVLIPAYAAIISLYSLHPAMLLFVLVIVWAADIGAYFAGKRFGRVKLAANISPAKTWEGVLGGLLLAALLVLVSSRWLETDIAVLLPFCLAVAIISIVGDLTVSMFKRDAGVKDSGHLEDHFDNPLICQTGQCPQQHRYQSDIGEPGTTGRSGR